MTLSSPFSTAAVGEERDATFLLVDDDDATNFLHRRTIRRAVEAARVDDVGDGAAGIAYLRARLHAGQAPPAFIFLDINMPRLDGWGFLEQYRELSAPWRVGTRLFVLTTSLNPDDRARATAYPEVAGVVDKVLDVAKLSAILGGGVPGVGGGEAPA